MTKDWANILDALKRQGWLIEQTNNGHTKALDPSGAHIVVMSVSSDDVRARRNALADLRRRGFIWPPIGQQVEPRTHQQMANCPACGAQQFDTHTGPPAPKSGPPKGSKSKGREACVKTGSCGLPPGHKHEGVTSSAAVWWLKMEEWWECCDQESAAIIYLAFSLEILQTAQTQAKLHPFDFTCCVLKERLAFEHINDEGERVPGEQPTHANMLVLLSRDVLSIDTFHNLLSPYGKVITPKVEI